MHPWGRHRHPSPGGPRSRSADVPRSVARSVGPTGGVAPARSGVQTFPSMSVKTELERLGLLAKGAHVPPDAHALTALCDAGVLEGGLSIALDLRPDELIGPLCERIGGAARVLKVLDVRDDPEVALVVDAGRGEEVWEVRDARDLVERCNEEFRQDPEARAVAVLGEWEDSLQLWCIPRPALSSLLRAPFFQAENRARLSALVLVASRAPR